MSFHLIFHLISSHLLVKKKTGSVRNDMKNVEHLYNVRKNINGATAIEKCVEYIKKSNKAYPINQQFHS
jgi:hypothetical protein